ncbi:Hypothetical predicted protein [Cloeon dipterum]|uniref:Uncharacterized protein n=1 Tax=Cloeon dipterum TaxID=197152 RepID=A0A8S1BZT7_9INSE|nr:Hypothetical predicted protein [Cloeon dipterum]
MTTFPKLGGVLRPIKPNNDSSYVEEISVFVSDNQEYETELSEFAHKKVEAEGPKTEEVPVITIRVPVNNEEHSNCDVELMYVPKSAIPADCNVQDGKKEESVFVVSANHGKRKNSSAPAPASKRVKIVPPQPPPKTKPKTAPVWERLVPKPPGSVSNYLFPHELRSTRTRLIIDCPTNIPVPEFKSQLADTRDIVTTMDLAPASKKKVKELNTNSVSKLFAYPGKTHLSPTLRRLYQRHLTSSFTTHEPITDLNLLSLDPNQPIRYSKSAIGAARNVNTAAAATPPASLAVEPKPTPVEEEDTQEEPQHQVMRFLIERDNAEPQEIIVLHDGVEPEESMQMILAAAAEGGEIVTDKNHMFLCDDADGEYIIVQNGAVEGGEVTLT